MSISGLLSGWPRRAYIFVVLAIIALVGIIFCVVQAPMLLGTAVTESDGVGRISTSGAQTVMAGVVLGFFALGLATGLVALSTCKRGRQPYRDDGFHGQTPIRPMGVQPPGAAPGGVARKGTGSKSAGHGGAANEYGNAVQVARSMSVSRGHNGMPPGSAKMPPGPYSQFAMVEG